MRHFQKDYNKFRKFSPRIDGNFPTPNLTRFLNDPYSVNYTVSGKKWNRFVTM